MIITGGENVYPTEVENVLYRHPAVKETAVIGIPDPYWVESVHAVVVPKENAQAAEEDIINFCRETHCTLQSTQDDRVRRVSTQKPSGKNTQEGYPIEILEAAGAGYGRGEPERLNTDKKEY